MAKITFANNVVNNVSNSSLPLNVFRSQLHVIRHLALTQHPWSGPFLADLEDCLASAGPTALLHVIYSELVRPSLDFDRSNGDPLMYLGPLLCAIPLGGRRPMIEDLVSSFLIRYIEYPDPTATSAEVYQLCELVKTSLLLLDHMEVGSKTDEGIAALLLRNLVADLDGFKARRSSGDTEGTGKKSRKRKHGGVSRSLGPGQTAILDVVDKVLRSDNELRSRWPDLL